MIKLGNIESARISNGCVVIFNKARKTFKVKNGNKVVYGGRAKNLNHSMRVAEAMTIAG